MIVRQFSALDIESSIRMKREVAFRGALSIYIELLRIRYGGSVDVRREEAMRLVSGLLPQFDRQIREREEHNERVASGELKGSLIEHFDVADSDLRRVVMFAHKLDLVCVGTSNILGGARSGLPGFCEKTEADFYDWSQNRDLSIERLRFICEGLIQAFEFFGGELAVDEPEQGVG